METLVVGAGVVGLAAARALAQAGHDVVVAEAAALIGSGVSSRNSEVIHAGMYYPTSSAKARLCVEGRRRLYAFCESHGVPHAKIGKLIVATSEAERGKIEAIAAQGAINEVEGLRLLDRAEALALEPNLACIAALLSPETGIIDSHALMLALQGDLEDHGGMVALGSPVERMVHQGGRWRVDVAGETMEFDAVVNAASLSAQKLAASTEGYPRERIPRLVLAKGSYFGCTGRPAFQRLIYPAPIEGGLGVHLTLDLAGRMRFGPDVEWIDDEHYEVDPTRAESFYEAIRRYWPALPDDALTADYSGIRPKLSGPGEPAADFWIEGPRDHGLPRLVNLFGIESPGLTSCLAIGDVVVNLLDEA
jgi:L-2-hydroxyglutarate oxidase LhgO